MGDEMTTTIPKHFCWTRFGTEAGETIDQIIRRKEIERLRNGGVFLWGIGNALGPSMRELLRREATPQVLFSPMLSAPKVADVAPARTVRWTAGRDLDGAPVVLPPCSTVTSRASTGDRESRHYALVCQSATSLRIDDHAGMISISALRNLLTENKVGSSQVTAVVTHSPGATGGGAVYAVAMRVRLVAPFFVVLTDARPVTRTAQRDLFADAV
jgi:hypothetical protein